MNARTVTMPPAMATLRTQATARWRGMSSRDRMALTLGLGVFVAFIVWLAFVAPAWRTARDAPAKLDLLEVQLQQMQRLSAEARTLRGAPEVSIAQAIEPIKVATGRLGPNASITFQGDRATLTLKGVSGEALRDWLSEARSAARARAVEVTLTRNPQGYSGTVIVTLGATS